MVKALLSLLFMKLEKFVFFIYFVFVIFAAHVWMRNCATNTIFILLFNVKCALHCETLISINYKVI